MKDLSLKNAFSKYGDKWTKIAELINRDEGITNKE